VLEYVGGESGVLMNCGQLVADAILIWKLRNSVRAAQAYGMAWRQGKSARVVG
jgi:hypothetical protein